ncbi:MAG: hypothetical protein ACXV3F_02115 [Frankiaceae bacterium]
MTPRLFGMVCLLGAVIGVGAAAYFWVSGSPATGVVLAVLTVLLLPSWLLYRVGWRRAQCR